MGKTIRRKKSAFDDDWDQVNPKGVIKHKKADAADWRHKRKAKREIDEESDRDRERA